MATQEIPLIEGAQTFLTVLNGVNYRFTLQWRDAPMSGWVLDIDKADGSHVVGGLPLITGRNLLAHCQHKLAGTLITRTANGLNPSYTGLGSDTRLYWVAA